MQTARIKIRNDIPEIRRAADFMDAFFARHPVPDSLANELHVVLDEILSNIVRHAYDDRAAHEIELTLSRAVKEVTLEVEDDGRPFDPTLAAPRKRPDFTLRKTSGLGLHFVRAFADTLTYQRAGGRNRLTVCRRIPTSGPDATPRPGLVLVESEHAGARMLTVQGRLDSASAPLLKGRLLTMVTDGARRLIVDLERVGYIGSAGFWALLAAERLLNSKGGALAICGLNDELTRALERGGLAEILRACASRDEAAARIQAAM